MAYPYQTRVSIAGTAWRLNGAETYAGSRAAGLLLNARMVNAVFEDAARPELDPDAITDRFIAALPEYAAHGLRAVTLGLQGGFPGHEGAICSAFAADGALRPGYMARVARAIAACDAQGMAVILSCYYRRQDQHLRDADALRAGVANVAGWIAAQGFGNVLLEVANEFGHHLYHHPFLCDSDGVIELMEIARAAAPGLLVSVSRQARLGMVDRVTEASDFIVPHFNRLPTEALTAIIDDQRRFGKPVLCNEDTEVGAEGARRAALCVAHGASWGLMQHEVNQVAPFRFAGDADDPVVYARLRALSTR